MKRPLLFSERAGFSCDRLGGRDERLDERRGLASSEWIESSSQAAWKWSPNTRYVQNASRSANFEIQEVVDGVYAAVAKLDAAVVGSNAAIIVNQDEVVIADTRPEEEMSQG